MLGFLVYPPLMPEESYSLEYKGEGQYQFGYYVNPSGAKWEAVFAVTVTLPVGGIGALREEVAFMIREPRPSREDALAQMRMFIVPEDLATPAGAISLRGAWNFKTAPGWDTVYTPVFNMIERPVAPMLVVRVETDWYMHESEFRYVLQQGEMYSAAHSLPIGQVVFVPREDVALQDCTETELAEIRQTQEEFSRDKAGVRMTTPYGVPYSPHYLRKSRSVKT